MELTPKQQTVELINQSKKILILSHINPDGDGLGSALALLMALKKLGKDVTVACSDASPQLYDYLPNLKEIQNTFKGQRDFIISVDTTNVKIDKLGYKNDSNSHQLNIVLTPKSGIISKDNISFNTGGAKLDLIFVLDSPDLDRIGRIYDENTDVFYETPIINIDHHPGNDYFGRVNWVDLTATSTAEILVALLESLGREKSLFDPDIATCLLTGITTDTGSFQHNNTTPKSFTVAAQLVAQGARQQEIVQNVYKTKSLSTLKLWGKILSSIKEEKKHRFVWSVVRESDFSQLNAEESETSGVVDELLKTVPQIDFAILLSEKRGGLHGSLRGVQRGINVAEIAQMFGGGGHELAAAFQINGTNFDDYKDKILIRIKEFQAKRLGLITDSIKRPELITEDVLESMSAESQTIENNSDIEKYHDNTNETNETPLDQIEVT